MNWAEVEHLAERWFSIHPNVEDINPLKGLKYTTNGWRLSLFVLLVEDLFITFLETQAQLAFRQGIDEQCQPHDHHESHDPLRFPEKQAVREEKRIFEKVKTVLDRNPLAGIVLQHL